MFRKGFLSFFRKFPLSLLKIFCKKYKIWFNKIGKSCEKNNLRPEKREEVDIVWYSCENCGKLNIIGFKI